MVKIGTHNKILLQIGGHEYPYFMVRLPRKSVVIKPISKLYETDKLAPWRSIGCGMAIVLRSNHGTWKPGAKVKSANIEKGVKT